MNKLTWPDALRRSRHADDPVETALVALHISQAYVCVQCNVVIATAMSCPRCGSGLGIASLSAWLGSIDAFVEAATALNQASRVMGRERKL